MNDTKLHNAEPFVGPADVAKFLSVSKRTVTRMARRRVIPAYRPLGDNGPARYRLSDVEKAMRRNQTWR